MAPNTPRFAAVSASMCPSRCTSGPTISAPMAPCAMASRMSTLSIPRARWTNALR